MHFHRNRKNTTTHVKKRTHLKAKFSTHALLLLLCFNEREERKKKKSKKMCVGKCVKITTRTCPCYVTTLLSN